MTPLGWRITVWILVVFPAAAGAYALAVWLKRRRDRRAERRARAAPPREHPVQMMPLYPLGRRREDELPVLPPEPESNGWSLPALLALAPDPEPEWHGEGGRSGGGGATGTWDAPSGGDSGSDDSGSDSSSDGSSDASSDSSSSGGGDDA